MLVATNHKVLYHTLTNFSQSIEVHLNCLVKESVPFQYAATTKTSSPPPQIIKTHKHPWCGIEVIINKFGSPRKGETGKIVNVLFGQQTTTGLKFEIQLTRYDPSTPFQKIIVDCDDVCEVGSVNLFFKDKYSMANLINLIQVVSSINAKF